MASLWFKREEKGEKGADCFYVHPTTEYGLAVWNVKRDSYGQPDKLPDFFDPDLIADQAGAFATSCNIWAPRYSQQGMLSMISTSHMGIQSPPEKRQKYVDSLLVGYADVKDAFEYFMKNRDPKRPFIVAAHSQGSILASKLIAECIDRTDLVNSFVAGYLAGAYLPKDLFGPVYKNISICNGPEDHKCIISWDTRVSGSWDPKDMGGIYLHFAYYLLHNKYCDEPRTDGLAVGEEQYAKPAVQVNPMTWINDGQGGKHFGVKLSTSDEPLKGPKDYGSKTKVHQNAMLIEDPKAWYTEYPKTGANFHPKDIQFFFFNIKQNVAARLKAFKTT